MKRQPDGGDVPPDHVLLSLARSLLAGVTAGVLLGLIGGSAFVLANRYLSHGLPRLALESFRDSLNRYALGTGLAFLAIAGAAFLLSALGRRPGFGAREARAVRRRLGGARPVGAALLLLAGVNASAGLLQEEPRTRLNVLLITIDTLRADHLGAYGYPRPTSPHIDALARQGVRFHRAVAQWPKTSPSFASMMSSTYGRTNGLIRTTAQRLPDRFFTLAELLKSGGFSTWAVVANVNLGSVFNFDQGFDTYVETWKEDGDERRRTELVTRRGLGLLADASRRRPFFVWLHYLDPHARYEPPAPYDGMFLGDKYFDASWSMPLLEKPRRDIGGIPTRSNLGREQRIAYYVAQYDAEIRYVDAQVGILLKALEEKGLAKNTLVVLTADHGESLGDHNYFFEHGRFPYDDCVRVPLIVRGPGTGTPGRVVTSPVELIDLLPTVLDLAGLPADPDAEGKSLRRLLEGDRTGGSRWRYAFTESGYAEDYQKTVVTDRYKLVYVPDAEDRRVMKGSPLELYDLEKDPGETCNLVEERPEIAAPLRKRLWDWMEDGGEAEVAPAAVPIDEGTERQLRSLGYIE